MKAQTLCKISLALLLSAGSLQAANLAITLAPTNTSPAAGDRLFINSSGALKQISTTNLLKNFHGYGAWQIDQVASTNFVGNAAWLTNLGGISPISISSNIVTGLGSGVRGANATDLQVIVDNTNPAFNTGTNVGATGSKSVVMGGANNVASGEYAVVCGGFSSRATGTASFIGNSGEAGAAGGNLASGTGAAIVAGVDCVASGIASFVGNGNDCVADGKYAAVGAGIGNVVYGDYGFIGGGERNYVGNGDYLASGAADGGAIVAGAYNLLGDYTTNCFIGVSKYSSIVDCNDSVIVAGKTNAVSGSGSGVLGGYFNTVSGSESFVIGSGVTLTDSQTVAVGYGANAATVNSDGTVTAPALTVTTAHTNSAPFFVTAAPVVVGEWKTNINRRAWLNLTVNWDGTDTGQSGQCWIETCDAFGGTTNAWDYTGFTFTGGSEPVLMTVTLKAPIQPNEMYRVTFAGSVGSVTLNAGPPNAAHLIYE